MNKPVVLVTAIGTVTATAIVIELKRTNNYYLIGADINNQNEIASSLDVDEYHTFPYASSNEYLDYVLDFCRDHHVDYYYAVLDIEVVKISEARERFLQQGTKLCVANYDFACKCHYKNEFSNWISEQIPELWIKTYSDFNELTDNSFPVFIKPVEGVASAGCRKISSMEELRSVVTQEDFNNHFLIQEYIEGDIITVDLIRNAVTGQSNQIQRKELLRNSNGCGIAVEILDDHTLRRLCSELMEKLDLNGVCNAEFFHYGEEYRIIEINPRFSAGSRYSCMAGCNTVLNALYIADGKECVFGAITVGKHFAERYEAYQMD